MINFESIKNIAVDPDNEFNNIISLNVIEKVLKHLIVASPNKIVSFSKRNYISKDYEVRDIIVNKEDIYVATIDGQIKKLTLI